MNIYVLRTAHELSGATHRKEMRGLLSYRAHGNILMSERLPADVYSDALVISSGGMDTHITPSVYDECRRRQASSVFLDADETDGKISHILSEVSASLARRGISVFCPFSLCDEESAGPVAELSVSGGDITEYLAHMTASRRRLALSVPRRCAEFSMPVFTASGKSLSVRECRSLIERFDAKVYFSPQMAVNYFIFSPENGDARFVLFDDARTVSEKLRIARKAGITDVFLAYREIADIYGEIMF
ncbi:MAG: hypothetical protein IJ299_02485 [Oscillospiraceae bacterium]|nr:hypothetical protein [Oscillospiraceae bacterium]